MFKTGITTLYLPFDVLLPEGVRAFIVTGVTINDDGTVQLVEEELTGGIPANTAVIIRGDGNEESILLTMTSDLEPVVDEDNNLLKGTLVPLQIDASRQSPNFMLYQEDLAEWKELADWQVPVRADGTTTYTLGANMAYLQLPTDNEIWTSSKFEELKALPHLQHTHGGCEICGQVTGVEAAWGTSADDLTLGGTLAEAVAAAAKENSTIGYIQLQEDVETVIFINGGNFTLDLNGHTITSEEHTLDIRNSNVAIVDNSENGEGKVITTVDGYYAVFVSDNASVTINGGSYESLHNVVRIDSDCSVTIEDGEFTSINLGVIETSGNLTIKGGGYQADEEGCEDISYCEGTMTFEVYEGIGGITIVNNSDADITPGSKIILPEGYCFYDYYEALPVEVLLSGGLYFIQEEPEKYTITFDANDGEGSMEDAITYYGNYKLPECGFTAPEGMMFNAWQIGEDEHQPGDIVTIEANTTITALWTTYVPQIVIRMHDHYGDGWHGDAIVVKKNGEEISTATIENGKAHVERYDYDNIAEYTFYWSCNHEEACCPYECSFEILVNNKVVFAAVRYDDGGGGTSDCQSYGDGQLIYTIQATVGGYCGAETNEGGVESVKWTLSEDNTTLTISGTGAMEDYSGNSKNPWWGKYGRKITTIVINDGITRIGKDAFGDLDFVTEITIPSNVKEIGSNAFYGCKRLATVTLNEGVEIIDGNAFASCEALTSFHIPASVTQMHPDAFNSSYVSYTVDEGNQTYTAQNGVLFSKDMTTIVSHKLNTSGATYTIPAGVTTIGEFAFRRTKLAEVILPEGLEVIENDAFNYPLDYSNFVVSALPSTVTTIGSYAFYLCKISEITIPHNVTSIGQYAFSRTGLTTVYVSCNPQFEYDFGTSVTVVQAEHNYVDGICTVCGHIDAENGVTIRDENYETFYVAEGAENIDITYTRTLPNLMWNALYVPFEIPVSALTDNYDVAYINDIRSYDTDENGEIDEMTMELIKLSSGTLHANHPYLIRAKNEEAMDMNLVLTDAILYNTVGNSFTCSSMYMEFTVTGSYNSLSVEELEGKYAISVDGAWQHLNPGTTLKPFRLYMEMTPRDGSPVKVESAALSRIRISVQGEEDGATGIEMVDTPQRETDGAFFDLSGRKVKAPVKGGIYIRNGKKILVK